MQGIGYFVPHFHIAIDMGVIQVIGGTTLHAYDVLRHAVWRDETQGPHGLVRRRNEGKLCCSLSQASIAAYLGVKQRAANGYIATLKRYGWLQTDGMLAHDSSLVVYHLGNYVSARKTAGTIGTHEVFFADDWLVRAHRSMTKHFRKAKRLGEVPFAERVSFLRTWADGLNTKAPRASGEDAKPNDDETLGDEPDARGDSESVTRSAQVTSIGYERE